MKHLLLLTFFLFSCSTFKNSNELNWVSLTSDFHSQNKVGFVNFIEVNSPRLFKQIDEDSKDKLLVQFWGNSFNFDSGAREKILKDEMIKDLQEKFHLNNNQYSVHAGVMHTYGYLFSNLLTPYGYKRARWLNQTLNNAFYLQQNLISPFPEQGTLLSNLTYLAGMVAFENSSNKEKLKSLKNVADEIKNYPYEKIKSVVVIEDVNLQFDFPYKIKTHFVKFLKKNEKEENDYVLIYSFLNKKTLEEKLITVFPIKKDAFFKAIDDNLMGEEKLILVKNNGDLGQSAETRFVGNRSILR